MMPPQADDPLTSISADDRRCARSPPKNDPSSPPKA
jgi:hypothetical protein